jgi:heptaprenyl diphosphate synthase
MTLAEIYLSLKKDIQYIEHELENAISTKNEVLYQSSNHLLKAGGKRIRPVFVLLAGKFGDYHIESLKNVAVTMELIHMATLVHDDVIDNAEMRRGQLTVKAKWDNRMAMYTGDYVLAEALLMITNLKSPRVHQILSRSILQMTIGEIEQIRDFYRWDQSVRNYLRRIKRKTAILIAISCQLGAIVSGCSEPVVRALYNFGHNAGMAFQITDDILDFVGDEKTLGKPAGSDLLQGNVTLPTIYCLHDEKYSRNLGQHVAVFNEYKEKNDESGMTSELAAAVELIRRSEGIDFAHQLAERYIEKALYWLEKLPDGESKKALREIAFFIGKRKF